MIVIDPVTIPFSLGLALRQITVQMTRDGEQTTAPKVLRVMRPADLTLLAAFSPPNGYSSTQTFLASAIDGEHLLLAQDSVTPKRSASRIAVVTGDVTFTLDLNDGAGGGSAGSPASLAARVKVEGVATEREVLAVERQSDGVWRVAGNLRTADGALDLRVVGGEVYALAMDDYGDPYQPNLIVSEGETIRPTLYAGWLYRITEAGVLPASEPEWWPADGDNPPRVLGTARAIAVRYYQPIGHGPLTVELT